MRHGGIPSLAAGADSSPCRDVKRWRLFFLVGSLVGPSLACGDDDGAFDSGDAGDTDADTSSPLPCFAGAAFGLHDASACVRASEDYAPGVDDAWPACLPDDGSYPLVAETPSSIERTAGVEQIRAWLLGTPTPESFTEARAIYSAPEGLESRVLRREDLRFPEIPMEQWDPGLDSDKQCSNPSLAALHPQRCAGPALIAPVLNEAFLAGQGGVGVPEVHAARIEAALWWFLYLSVYKEANTCFTAAAKDCDSSWAYYTGGFDRNGGLGLSASVRAQSELAHQAIWDGIAAFRCLRELAPPDEDPTLADLTAEQRMLFDAASGQLSDALTYGVALVVRARIVEQATVCDVGAAANWAFLQTLGPVLDHEGNLRNAAAYAPAAALWAAPAPMDEAALVAAVAALDAVFPCPY